MDGKTLARIGAVAFVALAITATAMPEAVISKEEATALLDEGETHGYSIAGITLTDRYPGKLLYEFSLVPDSTHSRKTNATLFIDAETGDPYAPLQDKAGITIEQAKEKAREGHPILLRERGTEEGCSCHVFLTANH